MTESLFFTLVTAWILLAIFLFPLLLKVKAPYGRHSTGGWGKMIDNRTAWIIMELPSLALFTILFISGKGHKHSVYWVFWALWVIHYFNRVIVFPIRTRTRGKKMPVLIMFLALIFNLINAGVNGYWLGSIAGSYGYGPAQTGMADYYNEWLSDPRFIIGIVMFVAGFLINQVADNHLIKLRKKKSGTYSIPTHRLFRHISCPNFGGEIMEWTGFAIMTWSLPGLSFALWTAVNLIPRAIHHHRWYKSTFPEYPENRKAVIPGIL